MNNFFRKNSGFTLIEVLVTATIIAVLTTIAVVSYSSVNKRSRDAKRKSDLEQIRTALEFYRSDDSHPYYPSLGSGSYDNATLLSVLVPTYISQIPPDPTSTYRYSYKATNLSGGQYYGYCLSAYLEGSVPASNPCPPDSSVTPVHKYAVKSP